MEFWATVRPMIASACDDLTDPESILRAILRGDKQLWIAVADGSIVAAGATEIVNHPKGRVCLITHIGGSRMDDWIAHQDTLAEWAREHGCDFMEVCGRKGWARALGWEPVAVTARREI